MKLTHSQISEIISNYTLLRTLPFLMQEIGLKLFISFKKLQNAGKYIIKSCKIRKEILPLLTN